MSLTGSNILEEISFRLELVDYHVIAALYDSFSEDILRYVFAGYPKITRLLILISLILKLGEIFQEIYFVGMIAKRFNNQLCLRELCLDSTWILSLHIIILNSENFSNADNVTILLFCIFWSICSHVYIFLKFFTMHFINHQDNAQLIKKCMQYLMIFTKNFINPNSRKISTV